MKLKKFFNKDITAIIILICAICTFFSVAGIQISRLATDTCFQTLNDATTQAATDIRTRIAHDDEQLDVIADLLAQHEVQDSEIIKKHLCAFHQRGMISNLGLLLPDNRFIMGSDEGIILENILDFNTEKNKLPYTSDIITIPDGRGEKGFYHAVPMNKEGRIIGILYGFVDLTDIANSIHVSAFDGNAQVYVADGATGDFLVDTWHDTLGNIFDEEILHRKVKNGYDFAQMKIDFVEGKTGHIAFWSNTAGEYFYSYYMPVGINQWMIQLTVPESIVFFNVKQIHKILMIVAIIESIVLLAYFLWVFIRVRRETAQKNRQLAQSQYMYDVQQTLFDAYKAPELFTAALQKVSEMLTADTACFLTLEGNRVKESFYSAVPETKQKDFFETDQLEIFSPEMRQSLIAGQSLLLYPEDIQMLENQQDRAELSRRQINNLMLVPVLASNEELVGILGSINMKQRWTNATLLECVSRNFLMALSNMKFYSQIEHMSIIDALTGLRNRNCFERSLNQYDEENICCLYLDADGLHALNNTLGHAAGDAMLVCISDSLKQYFMPQDCYRIGGDEFTAFSSKYSKDEIGQCIVQLHEQMALSGYHISIGEAWRKESRNVNDMIKTAEKNMYEAKRLYYQQSGNLSKARMMNQKLERILSEKKDIDAFLDIIASRFMGTYVVDLDTDWARTIYVPSYFSTILEENDYYFSPSMETYIRTHIADEDQQKFLDFLDYNNIRQKLQTQDMITHTYRKKDNTKLILCVYPMQDPTSTHTETIWLFEEDNQ